MKDVKVSLRVSTFCLKHKFHVYYYHRHYSTSAHIFREFRYQFGILSVEERKRKKRKREREREIWKNSDMLGMSLWEIEQTEGK